MAQDLTEGIMLFLRVKWIYCMDTLVKTHVTEFGGFIEVVGGVVFSLTQLDSIELVVSSLTN